MKTRLSRPRYLREHSRAFAFAAAAIITIAALALWATRKDDAPRGQVRPEALTRSDDMAGMNMSSDGSVLLSAGQLLEFGITFASVELRPLSGELRTVGSVVVDETRITAVTARVSGFVEQLHADFHGHPVRRGQALLELYSPEILATQDELLLAVRLQGATQSDVPGVPRSTINLQAAARQRLRLWDVSEAQIDGIVRSGVARRTVTIFSPATGVVLDKNVVAGQSVEAGAALFRIADLSRVWIEALVHEADATAITMGARAAVESTALPGRVINGTVEYVHPLLDEASRSLRVRIALENPGGVLRPGMYVTVRIALPGRSALSVPAAAIVNTGERTLVFVDYGGGRLRSQQVVVGRVTGEYAEIMSGLEPGQRVVTSAQFLLDSESNLAEVMRGMISQGAAGMEPMPTPPAKR